jgi:hypothetical protein
MKLHEMSSREKKCLNGGNTCVQKKSEKKNPERKQ